MNSPIRSAFSRAQAHEANPGLRLLYNRFFDSIRVDGTWVSTVRELSAQGTVVYVLRNLNFVDFLALDHLTKRFDLPQIRFANDLRLGPLNPIRKGLLDGLTPRPIAAQAADLRAALSEGGSAALFLKRPPGVIDVASGQSRGRGMREGDSLLQTLIEVQRVQQQPILLVPQVFVWTNRPDTQGAHWLDAMLGPREWPSALRTVGQFLYNYKHVALRAGEPLALTDYLQSHVEASDAAHVRRITYAILRRLERERRAVTGPAQKPPDRVRHQVLRSPKLQATIRQMAGERSEDRRALTQRTLSMVRDMQAIPETATIKGLEVLLDRVFTRIYAGIDVDHAGIEQLRELSKEHSLVLLPSHKSHVDYLVLSYIFNEHGLQLPVIAAGDNLSFFPLGPVLRRAGGFFIRRTFRGDKLYSATVEAYVRRLIRDGYTLELFIEGGRSRTGKLRPPQLGLLSMLVDAALSVTSRQVYFVPVSIGYERIVETRAYEAEMSGEDKRRESAAALFKTTEVLRHKYGSINVQFGSPLTIGEVRTELNLAPEGGLSPAKRRAVVTRLGNRSMDEINRVTAVTPGALTAMALLSDRRRAVTHEELLARCDHLLLPLHEQSARCTQRVAVEGKVRASAIREAVQMFVDAELLEAHRPGDSLSPHERREHRTGAGMIYRIPERKRLELDTTKNIIVHFFVERALVAVCALLPPGTPLDREMLADRVKLLSRLFKHEFRFHPDGFEENFQSTLEVMERAGELATDPDGRVTLGPGRANWSAHVWLRTYASIVRTFIEGYRVAARGLHSLLKGPMSRKDLVKRTLAEGNRMFLAGDVELREAVSSALLDNALLAFREEGYLHVEANKLSLSPSFATPDAVRAIEGRIAGYLEISPE